MGNTQSTAEAPTMLEKPTSYPIRTKTNTRKPQPFVGSFYDTHMAIVPDNNHMKKQNRPAATFNYFEVAAATAQPVSTKSIHSNSSSSIKSSSKKSTYPSSTNTSSHQLKKHSTNLSNVSSVKSSHSSIASTAVGTDNTAQKKDSNYIEFNGRSYWKGHGEKNFLLPCDDDENDRLMTMHYILKSTFHGNFISPIQSMLDSETNRTKVLDIGCGSGTWILEMATEFPNSDFYGVDDCPLFPTSIKPPNAHFRLHDVLKGIAFEDCQFDFVYMRLMILYFTPEELSQLLKEISRVMKPGGYFEVVDTSYTIRNPGPLCTKLVNSEIKNVLHKSPSVSSYESNTNHPIFTFLMLAPQENATSFIGNFIDICQEHTTLPLGGWDQGQIGNLHSLNFKHLLCSLQSLEHDSVPLSKEAVDSILEECGQNKSYLDWFSCYARKPLHDDQLEQSTLDSIYEFVEGFVDV
ncbi:hypothetical protein EDC94DRAFT_594020 [Helicostylum pulchrum]|nr:hypothetical protein EDC94DRAFT_594020 [Helicostylum pulchrum]